MTKQFKKRAAILSCLRGTKAHPSAEMVYEMLRAENPDISLATVYRNLTLFKNQGLIRSLGTVDGVERFDGRVEPHVHFVCTGCDAVTDLDNVVLPTGLKDLGRNAFMQCSSLSRIVVPAGIETMGTSVFNGCTSLTSVTLSEGLTMLPESTFAGCTALKQITLPHTVSSIPGSLFYRCQSLEAIEIPDNITSIGSSAFYECSSLRSVTIYGTDVDINYSAFSYNPSDLVIYCYPGSTAEQYAKDHNIQFEYIGAQAETYTLTAEVLDPDGQAVTGGFTVNTG